MRNLFYPLILFSLLLSSCYMIRAYKYRHLSLRDHVNMPYVSIEKSDQPFSFIEDTIYKLPLKKTLDSTLQDTYTAAFLVVRNDSILYEHYFNGFTRQSLLPSFSVAKSFVSTAIGIAIGEGKINSTTEAVTVYLPELLKADPRFEKITLQHLLDMRSGIRFNEGGYNLKDDAIRLGFRPNIGAQLKKLKIEKDPGGDMRYQSINTQLLGMVIARATGQTLAHYIQEKIWKPLGAESNATWNVDSKKHQQEIAFAALNATARDFAKLGRLFAYEGNWNGQQLLSKQWVQASVSADSLHRYNGYRNQWWGGYGAQSFTDSMQAVQFTQANPNAGGIRSYTNKQGALYYQVRFKNAAFYAQGILGQFIYVDPVKKIIIVRLGHSWKHPQFRYINGFIFNIAREL